MKLKWATYLDELCASISPARNGFLSFFKLGVLLFELRILFACVTLLVGIFVIFRRLLLSKGIRNGAAPFTSWLIIVGVVGLVDQLVLKVIEEKLFE